MHESFTFTATGTTEVLSFLALGTPEGKPPFSLLDGVSGTVPEPATWAMMIGGLGLVGGAMRAGRRGTVAA
ncbi:PEPxxWA-CTERM sorting domain-containing protein [Polymorphobacter megasporae]|nr:PEPxxWA-CTERM sorting domain-containing protein [Polymorphobacter megasporae]